MPNALLTLLQSSFYVNRFISRVMCRSSLMWAVGLSPRWRGMQSFLVKALELDREKYSMTDLALTWKND